MRDFSAEAVKWRKRGLERVWRSAPRERVRRMPYLKAVVYSLVALLISARIVLAAQSDMSEFRGVRVVAQGVVHASSADAFADGIAAVNTRFCQRATGYQTFATSDDATVEYLVKGGFRHIRDGGTLCADDSAFAKLVNGLYREHGIDLLATIEPCTSDSGMRKLFAQFPAIRSVEGPNEYDESKPSTFATAPAAAGEERIATSSDARTSFAISQRYLFGEGPDQEAFTAAECPDAHTVRAQAPLRNAHRAGFATGVLQAAPAGSRSISVHDVSRLRAGDWITLDCTAHSKKREVERIVRIDGTNVLVQSPLRFDHDRDAVISEECLAAPNGYVSDLQLIYQRIAAVIKNSAQSSTISILADSQAEQANNALFAESGIDRFEDIGNLHDYPAGRNPGGAGGDGTRGFGGTFVGCGPYGAYWYNMCAESLQFKYANGNRQIKPVWTTEVSYNVSPIGGPFKAVQHGIPDDVAVKYLPRLEFFYLGNGHSRVYWFELVDSASGCGNVFGAYGLVRRCPRGSPTTPKPEYDALTDMIKLFSDPECRYPTCALRPSDTSVAVSSVDKSFQYHLFEKHDGTYLLAFWLERPSYDAESSGECHLTMRCYVAVPPQPVSVTVHGSDAVGGPTLRTFVTDSADQHFGHLTNPVPTSISASGVWTGSATDTVQILSWKGSRR